MSPAKRTAMVAALWIVGCTMAGVGVDMWWGEHTGIVFVFIAFCIGVAGAVAHSALLFAPRYRSAPLMVQVALSWIGTLLGLVLYLAMTGHLSESWTPDIRADIPIAVLAPSLLAALLFSTVVYRYMNRPHA